MDILENKSHPALRGSKFSHNGLLDDMSAAKAWGGMLPSVYFDLDVEDKKLIYATWYLERVIQNMSDYDNAHKPRK